MPTLCFTFGMGHFDMGDIDMVDIDMAHLLDARRLALQLDLNPDSRPELGCVLPLRTHERFHKGRRYIQVQDRGTVRQANKLSNYLIAAHPVCSPAGRSLICEQVNLQD